MRSSPEALSCRLLLCELRTRLLFGEPHRQSIQQPQVPHRTRERRARWAALFAAHCRYPCRDQRRKPWRERPRRARFQWPRACPEGSLTPWLSVSVSLSMRALFGSPVARVICGRNVSPIVMHFVRTIWSRSCGKFWSPNWHSISGPTMQPNAERARGRIVRLVGCVRRAQRT